MCSISKIDGHSAIEHTKAIAEVEEWDHRKLDEALCDVSSGATQTATLDINFSSITYGVVVGENPELDKKIAGFPQFGDVVIFKSDCGMDSTSFGRLSRGSGKVNEYIIRNRDGSRRLSLQRSDKLVILDWQDIIGAPDGLSFSERERDKHK